LTQISNVRKITKFKRSIRAISPVIATLLMIAIAVVASLVVYAWVTGYIGGTTTTAGNAIQIQSYGPGDNDNQMKIYVQNVGQGPVEILKSGGVYINGIGVPLVFDVGSTAVSEPIDITETKELVVDLTPATWAPGQNVVIKVVTNGGTITQTTGSGTTSNTQPIALNPSSGGITTDVTVTGSGFTANAPVTVMFGTTLVRSTTATPTGALPLGVTFNVPDIATGFYVVTVSDGTHSPTATFTITDTNTAPVATDDSYSTTLNTNLQKDAATGVLANDDDADNDPLTAILVAGPSHGIIDLELDGAFTYAPTNGYTGDDSFTYKANDGTADSNTATVSITINTASNPQDKILRPIGTGSQTGLSDSWNDHTNWECVAETTDEHYVYRNDGEYRTDTYSTEDPSLSGTINSVTIYIRAQRESGWDEWGHAQTVLRIVNPSNPSSPFYAYGNEIDLTSSWSPYNTPYTINPRTSNAWTWQEIIDLQCGVRLQGSPARCSQVWVVVNYTP
jgi:flagellin-like protein